MGKRPGVSGRVDLTLRRDNSASENLAGHDLHAPVAAIIDAQKTRDVFHAAIAGVSDGERDGGLEGRGVQPLFERNLDDQGQVASVMDGDPAAVADRKHDGGPSQERGIGDIARRRLAEDGARLSVRSDSRHAGQGRRDHKVSIRRCAGARREGQGDARLFGQAQSFAPRIAHPYNHRLGALGEHGEIDMANPGGERADAGGCEGVSALKRQLDHVACLADHRKAPQRAFGVRAEEQGEGLTAQGKVRRSGQPGQDRPARAGDGFAVDGEDVESALFKRGRNQAGPGRVRGRQEYDLPRGRAGVERAGDNGASQLGRVRRAPRRAACVLRRVAGGQSRAGEEERCAQGPRTAKVRPGPFWTLKKSVVPSGEKHGPVISLYSPD